MCQYSRCMRYIKMEQQHFKSKDNAINTHQNATKMTNYKISNHFDLHDIYIRYKYLILYNLNYLHYLVCCVTANVIFLFK